MNWINTRSDFLDEAVRQSMVPAYHFPYERGRVNHWMNLDNGDTLWMLADGYATVRFFRHFPSTNAVVEVTASLTGQHIDSPVSALPRLSTASRWEAYIDKLLNVAGDDDQEE